jgi:PKHD-type hydroxylase
VRMIQQARIPAWLPFVFFEKEFSKEECETIINLSKTVRPDPAKTGSNDDPKQDPKIRVSELRWLNENDQCRWIFDRLENVCQKVKQSWYPFNLSGFAEPLQITHYFGSAGAHYDWHQDFGPEAMSTRKLSIVMLLNDPSEFKGGELEIMSVLGENKAVNKVAQGTVIAFPSWEFHRVLKVTEGERWSLVTWVHGVPFS